MVEAAASEAATEIVPAHSEPLQLQRSKFSPGLVIRVLTSL